MLLEAKLGDLEEFAFAARNALLSRTKILSGFLQAMLAPFGVKLRLPYGPVGACWCHLGANFGDFGAVLKAIWDLFRPCYFGILKNNPKLYLQNALPSGP